MVATLFRETLGVFFHVVCLKRYLSRSPSWVLVIMFVPSARRSAAGSMCSLFGCVLLYC